MFPIIELNQVFLSTRILEFTLFYNLISSLMSMFYITIVNVTWGINEVLYEFMNIHNGNTSAMLQTLVFISIIISLLHSNLQIIKLKKEIEWLKEINHKVNYDIEQIMKNELLHIIRYKEKNV
jgi:hypothetical protein